MRRHLPLVFVLVLACTLTACAAQGEGPSNQATPLPPPPLPLSLPVVVKGGGAIAAMVQTRAVAPRVAGSSAQAAPGTPETTAITTTTTSPTSSAPAYYVVKAGDSLGVIAERFGVKASELAQANNLANPDAISVGQKLKIPGGVGGDPEPAPVPTDAPAAGQPGAETAVTTTEAVSETAPLEGTPVAEPAGRGTPFQRMTFAAQVAPANSPYRNVTWVTYYGRPRVPILGILGEYSIDDLVPRLRAQAAAYDEANGPDLGVMPAFHLIYGMATSGDPGDGSHLDYMPDDDVLTYIQRAQKEGWGVILDVQIGGLTPLASIKPAFRWLQYENVQLALDPEFAMTTPGQTIPGAPPGTITAQQINEVQASMSTYLQLIGSKTRRILIVHQFLPWMIDDKSAVYAYDGIDFTVCADGFGEPWPKISKYNVFMDENVPFTGYKLFYGYDKPLMTERQAMGVDEFPGVGYIEETPNLIIYQ